MAWNGSNTPNNSPGGSTRAPSPSAPRKTYLRGLLAGLLVVAAGGATLWYLGRDGVPSPSAKVTPDKASGSIAEVKPAAAPTNKVETSKSQSLSLNMKRDHSELTREELLTKVPHWAYSVEDRKRVDPGYEKRHDRFIKKIENSPWKTHADNVLAVLLFGDGNLGWMPPFNANFKNNFLKSIETPIIVSKDDPPELQEQKKQLIETKIWLKEQMDAGQDIVNILNEEYNRQKKIVGLRDNLKRELFQLQKTAKSVQEIDDFVTAANAMLKDAGATHEIKGPFSLMTKLRLERESISQSKENM